MELGIGTNVSVMINRQEYNALIQEINPPYIVVELSIPIKHGSAEPTKTIKVHKKHVNVTK